MTRTCNETDLKAYVEGQLSERDQERIESHCLECEACRSQLEALLSPIWQQVQGSIEVAPVPPRVLEQIGPIRRRPVLARLVPLVAAAACVLVAVWFAKRPGSDSHILAGRAFAASETTVAGSSLPERQMLVTTARTNLKIGDSTVQVDGPLALLQLDRSRAGTKLNVLVGKVFVSEPKQGKNKVRVLCAGREYIALGTNYSVDASEGLRVTESTVEALYEGKSQRVGAGQRLDPKGEFGLLDNAGLNPGGHYLVLQDGKLVERHRKTTGDSLPADIESAARRLLSRPSPAALLDTIEPLRATNRQRASEWVNFWVSELGSSLRSDDAKQILEGAGSLLSRDSAQSLALLAGGDFGQAVTRACNGGLEDEKRWLTEVQSLSPLQAATVSEVLLDRGNEANEFWLWRAAYKIAKEYAESATDPSLQKRLWRVCAQAGFRSQIYRTESLAWNERLQATCPTPAGGLDLAVKKLEASAISDKDLYAAMEAALQEQPDYVMYERIIAALRIMARTAADWQVISDLATWVADAFKEVPAARALRASIEGPTLHNWQVADPIVDHFVASGEAKLLPESHRIWIARRLIDRGDRQTARGLIESCENHELVANLHLDLGNMELAKNALANDQRLEPTGQFVKVRLAVLAKHWQEAEAAASFLAHQFAAELEYSNAANTHLYLAENAPQPIATRHAKAALRYASMAKSGWPVRSKEADRIRAIATYYRGDRTRGIELLESYLAQRYDPIRREEDETRLSGWKRAWLAD